MDGTRSFLLGTRTAVVIDPGPNVPEHVRALASAVAEAESVTLLLTHGHPDHSGAAAALAAELGAEVWGPDGLDDLDRSLRDGEAVVTDEGTLVAIATPGHARAHHCYHLPERRWLFAGDFLLGTGDTTWVGEYSGCVADYLTSLRRLRSIDVDVVYPAHGPPIDDPSAALDRFEAHREARIQQVRTVLARRPEAGLREILDAVYGERVPVGVRDAARRSLAALVEYVRAFPA